MFFFHDGPCLDSVTYNDCLARRFEKMAFKLGF